MTDSESILNEIEKLEIRLAKIDQERKSALRHLAQLRDQLAQQETPSFQSTSVLAKGASFSPKEKIALFRSLFVGRTDVFPRYWRNQKTGKKGYSPVCGNEWVRGLCEKPQVKCGDCPNQAFVPVTDQVLLDHLQGRHVAGVYPLLEDETCRFLSVDFDKGSWKEDVTAFVSTCRNCSMPVCVERSRSGNGAHIWFFFSERIPASVARKLGCCLITQAMRARHELSMSSYDRLFPNQDTMPRGGFGNLIALPLQYHARQRGNTVFVDDNFVEYPDQWAYLTGVKRLDLSRVNEFVQAAARNGDVIGVGATENGAEADSPWEKRPSKRSSTVRVQCSLPAAVNCVLAQQVFVEKNGLSSALLDQIKRLAAFQNPEFYKKQAMRLSTALTPRVISCAEELPKHVALPRGCLEMLEELLDSYGSRLAVDDQRFGGAAVDLEFHGKLTSLQEEAVRALLDHDSGVLVAPPGSGKTVVGTFLVSSRACNALILVHRTQLLDQWRAQLSTFLNVKLMDIGQIGGGKRRTTGRVDVAMIQSLVRRDDVDDLVANYGLVIVDECHHVPAVSFEKVMREVRARHVTGLTATPQRRDGHQPILQFQIGPVRFSVDPKNQSDGRGFDHRVVVRETALCLSKPDASGIQEIYGQLASNVKRNDMILDDVIQALEDGRSPILLTERRDHLGFFAEKLRGFTRHLVILRGGMGAKQRREVMERMASIPETEERLLLATGRFIGEGFDDSRLDTLFLTLPVSWKGTLVQYAGRLHRAHHAKSEVRIYDYVDTKVPMLARMFEKRVAGYRAMGYRIEAESR